MASPSGKNTTEQFNKLRQTLIRRAQNVKFGNKKRENNLAENSFKSSRLFQLKCHKFYAVCNENFRFTQRFTTVV